MGCIGDEASLGIDRATQPRHQVVDHMDLVIHFRRQVVLVDRSEIGVAAPGNRATDAMQRRNAPAHAVPEQQDQASHEHGLRREHVRGGFLRHHLPLLECFGDAHEQVLIRLFAAHHELGQTHPPALNTAVVDDGSAAGIGRAAGQDVTAGQRTPSAIGDAEMDGIDFVEHQHLPCSRRQIDINAATRRPDASGQRAHRVFQCAVVSQIGEVQHNAVGGPDPQGGQRKNRWQQPAQQT